MKHKVTQTNRLLDFADFRKFGNVFIETGTCMGRSVQAALTAGYEKVKSVEAKDEFYQHCKILFAKRPEVELFFGKSIDHLPAMMSGLQGPAVFWLDAHVSGERSAGYHDYLEKGEGSDFHQNTAIKKELAIILARAKMHTILIDDQNGQNADNEVYMDILSMANPGYKFYWIDEQSGDVFYKDKILAAIDETFQFPPQK